MRDPIRNKKDIGGGFKTEYFETFPFERVPHIRREKNPISDIAVVYVIWNHPILIKTALLSVFSFLKYTDLLNDTTLIMIIDDAMDISEYEERLSEAKIEVIRMPYPINRYFAVQHPRLTEFERVVTLDVDVYAYNPCQIIDVIRKANVPLAVLPLEQTMERLLQKRKGLSIFKKKTYEEYIKALADVVRMDVDVFMELVQQEKERVNGIFTFWHNRFFTDPDWIDFSKRLYEATKCNSDELNWSLYFLGKEKITFLYEIGLPVVSKHPWGVNSDSVFVHPWGHRTPAGVKTDVDRQQIRVVIDGVMDHILGHPSSNPQTPN